MDIQKILEISVPSTDVQSVDRSFLQGRIFFPLTPSYNTHLPTQSILVSSPLTIGRLSNDDGDGKEDGKNAIGLDWQNNNFARASRFLYISLPSLHDYNVKVPNFTFCRGREQTTTTFFFFSELQSFRIQLQKICRYLINWTSWNKRDKFWSSANSLFEWRFRNRRCRCCLRSISSWMDPWLLFSAVIHNTSAKR